MSGLQNSILDRALPTDDWDARVSKVIESQRNGLAAAASRIVGRDHAADVVQDAFLRVWCNPERYDESRGTLTKYTYVVVRGVAIDRLRRNTSLANRELNACVSDEIVDDLAGPMIRTEARRRVRAALDTIRPEERDAIVAAFFGHLTYCEVALLLGVPEGTVKSRIRLGLVRMRQQLADDNSITEQTTKQRT